MAQPLDPALEHARAILDACDLHPKLEPHAHARSAELEWAQSGAMALTGPSDSPPQFPRGAIASAARGAAIALQTLACTPQLDAIDAPALLGERAAIAGLVRRGSSSAGGSARLLKTSGNGIVLNLPRKEDWDLIPALLESDHSNFALQQNWRVLAQLVSERDPSSLVKRGRLMGLAIAPIAQHQLKSPPLLELHHASECIPLPLSSQRIRLLDLSNLWAGPLASSLLAKVGIEVLKIENPERPDGARNGPKAFFDLLNGDKQSCALNLRHLEDRSAFERLLETTDIVIESARPRALSQLGIDAKAWVSDRPGRIWASITGYGRAKEWIAFGDDAAVAAGLAQSTSPVDPEPRFCGDAIADPLTGLHAAALILGHLRKGRGGLLDLSLVETAAHSASIDADEKPFAIEAKGKSWVVIQDGHETPIAKPRARRVHSTAAPLHPPHEDLLSDWAKSC